MKSHLMAYLLGGSAHIYIGFETLKVKCTQYGITQTLSHSPRRNTNFLDMRSMFSGRTWKCRTWMTQFGWLDLRSMFSGRTWKCEGHRSVTRAGERAGDFWLGAAPYKFVGGTLTSACSDRLDLIIQQFWPIPPKIFPGHEHELLVDLLIWTPPVCVFPTPWYEYSIVPRKIFGHNWSKSYLFPTPTNCMLWSFGFLCWFEAYSTDSLKWSVIFLKSRTSIGYLSNELPNIVAQRWVSSTVIGWKNVMPCPKRNTWGAIHIVHIVPSS
jgi:hypothetical protein